MKELTIELPSVSSEESMTSDISLDPFLNLLTFGALTRVTELTINTGVNHLQIAIFNLLPQIISRLPDLKRLVIEHLHVEAECGHYFDFSTLPKFISRSLRSLEVHDFKDVLPFLSLFSDCPIDLLEIHADTPCLEGVSECLPGLRTLVYVSVSNSFVDL